MPTADGSYVPVDIPFIAGQEESYDRKILPVGPLRKVQNAFQERTGRWTERRALSARQLVSIDNINLGSLFFRSALPEDHVSLHARGTGRVAYFGNTITDDEFVRTASGEYGGFGFLGQFFAAGYPSSKTDGVTFSPSVACSQRHILFVFLSTSKVTGVETTGSPRGQPYHVNVLWYDINTLRLVRVEAFQPTGQPDDLALEVKVAVTDTGQVTVGVNTRDGNATSGQLRLFTWTGPGSPRVAGAIYTTRPYSTFDLVGVGSWYWLCFCSSTNVVTLMRASNASVASTATQALPAAPGTTSTVYCSVAASDTVNSIGIGTHSGTPRGYARLRYYHGTLTQTSGTVGARGSAEYVGFMGTDQVSAFTSVGPFIESFNYDNSFTPNASVQVSRNAYVVGHPIIPDSVVGTAADARGYVPLVGGGLYKHTTIDYTTGGGVVTAGDSAAYAHLDGSPEAFVRFGDETQNVPVAVGGMLARAGGIMMERLQDMADTGLNFMPNVPKTTACRPVRCGNKYWVVPVEQNYFTLGQKDAFLSSASFVLLDHENAIGGVSGVAWDRQNLLVSGVGTHAVDDQALFFAGFTDRPIIEVTFTPAIPPGTESGGRTYIVVAEYRDAMGRLWRSAPSQPVLATKDGPTLSNRYFYPPAGAPAGTRMVVYGNEDQGSVFYQHSSYSAPGYFNRDNTTDADLIKGAPIYTAGGVLENSPPPAARFLVRTRDRVWAGLLDYPGRVQSSKFIRPTEGVHWSDADQFFVDIPQSVTGLGAMDDVLVVFTDDNIYIVHGDGPSDLGVGNYAPPQKIPSDVGCVQGRSIVTDENGIFFLSRRGIELLSRGFSAPVFIGDSVRDVVEEHPFCLDSAVYQSDKTVRWLLSNVHGGDQSTAKQAIVVFDTRTRAWSTYQADNTLGMGRALGAGPDRPSDDFPPDSMSLYFPLVTGHAASRETFSSASVPVAVIWETGEIRPAGLLAGALGRVLNVLGTYRHPVDITVQMAFDDAKDWHPTWVKTWHLDDSAYSNGDAVTLELTLPQQKFQAARFRITALRTGQPHPGFDGHGVTVYFDSEGAGPRRTIGRAQKG